jgi:hypothetical protein
MKRLPGRQPHPILWAGCRICEMYSRSLFFALLQNAFSRGIPEQLWGPDEQAEFIRDLRSDVLLHQACREAGLSHTTGSLVALR